MTEDARFHHNSVFKITLTSRSLEKQVMTLWKQGGSIIIKPRFYVWKQSLFFCNFPFNIHQHYCKAQIYCSFVFIADGLVFNVDSRVRNESSCFGVELMNLLCVFQTVRWPEQTRPNLRPIDLCDVDTGTGHLIDGIKAVRATTESRVFSSALFLNRFGAFVSQL